MKELFTQFDDKNNIFNKKEVFFKTILNLKDQKKPLIDSLHKKIKVIDLITLLSVLITGVIGIMAIEDSLTFMKVDLKGEEILYNHTICELDDGDSFIFSVNKTINLQRKERYDVTSDEIKSMIPCIDKKIQKTDILRFIISGLTVLILIMLVIRYKLLLNFNKLRSYLKENETLISSGYYKFLILELILNVIHPIPKLNLTISISQRYSQQDAFLEINILLTILLLFFRSYHIFKYFSFHSRWYSYETEKLCLQSQTILDSVFTIKAEFKEKPFVLVGATMIISIFIFGYSLRTVEMCFMATSGQNWMYFWNGLWCIIITMTTVGFGDFFPVSIIGRIIAIISCFWGTFLISLMVAAMTVTVEFNSQEAIAYDSIKAAYFEIDYGTQATILIQTAFRYRKILKNQVNIGLNERKKSSVFQKLKLTLEKFRKMKKSKNESLEAMLIELSISKIEENLTVEMEKIKNQLFIIDEIRDLIDEYSDNQEKLKMVNMNIYKDLQDMCIKKARFEFDD